MRFRNDEEMVRHYEIVRTRRKRDRSDAIWSVIGLLASVPTFIAILKFMEYAIV